MTQLKTSWNQSQNDLNENQPRARVVIGTALDGSPSSIVTKFQSESTVKGSALVVSKADVVAEQEKRPTVKLAILNSMSKRAPTDVMLTRRIAEALDFGVQNGKLKDDIDIELVFCSPEELDHRLEGAAAKQDLSYVHNHHTFIGDAEHCVSPATINADAWFVSGAVPREQSMAEEKFYPAMKQVIDHTRNNRVAAVYSCAASQAYLETVHEVPRVKRDVPLFGHFTQTIENHAHPLMEGIPESQGGTYELPLSRGWQSDEAAFRGAEAYSAGKIETVVSFEEGGASIVVDKTSGAQHILVTSHPEYDFTTLKKEYDRNSAADPNAALPVNYNVEDVAANQDAYKSQARLIFNSLAQLIRCKQLEAVREARQAHQPDVQEKALWSPQQPEVAAPVAALG